MSDCTIQNSCMLLVVDDEEDIRLLFDAYRGTFLDKGLELVIAESLAQAVDLLSKYQIVVILLDLKMVGESDGAETVRYIRQYTNAPIFAYTGAADSQLIDLCVNYGAERVLLKGEHKVKDLPEPLSKAAANYRKCREIKQGFNSIIAGQR